MVQIIPKPIEREIDWKKIFFYFSIFFLFLVIISLPILNFLQKKSEVYLQDLEEKIAKGKTPEKTALEKEILNYQKEIKDFSPLLSEHTFNTKFFQFLEEKVHPKVFFSQINLNSKETKVSLSGQTDNFFTLGQQLLIFEKEPLIESLNLSEISLSKEGKVNFVFDLKLNKEIFEILK